MLTDRSALHLELTRLRKGRGVFADDVAERTGPELRALCAITASDDQATLRAKLVSLIERLSRQLPDDLRIASGAAFAIHPDARQRFLRDRMEWLGQRLRRDSRTARRRADEALRRLAELAAAPAARPAVVSGDQSPDAWYVEAYRVVLRLDADSPQTVEERRIVSLVDGLDQIEYSISLPRDASDSTPTHELGAEVLFGGSLVGTNHPSDSHFGFVIRLPRVLNAGDRHSYGLIVRIPAGQPMAAHYVFNPLQRCDSFELIVRFAPARVPRAVWKVAGIPPRTVDDRRIRDDRVVPDRFGQVQANFVDMRPGLGYGIQWEL